MRIMIHHVMKTILNGSSNNLFTIIPNTGIPISKIKNPKTIGYTLIENT